MDTATAAAFTGTLTTLGLPGLIIFALLSAVAKLHKMYAEQVEKRISESRENVQCMERTTTAINSLTDYLKERRP